jgi:hypothetical protein
VPPRFPHLLTRAPAGGPAAAWAALLDVTAAFCGLVLAVNAWAPPQDLPWAAFSLDQPAGLATRFKLHRIGARPLACREALAAAGVSFREIQPQRVGPCLPVDVVRLDAARDPPMAPAGPPMTCALALGYAGWLRHSLEPAARAALGERLAAVDHVGTFACRNIYGEVDGRRSEHAFANAIDLVGVRMASGRQVTVAGDYGAADPAGRFLRLARDGACAWFDAVLGPDYDLQHRDRLHLDEGRNRVCS